MVAILDVKIMLRRWNRTCYIQVLSRYC